MQASPLNDVRKLLTGPSKKSSQLNEVKSMPAAKPQKASLVIGKDEGVVGCHPQRPACLFEELVMKLLAVKARRPAV